MNHIQLKNVVSQWDETPIPAVLTVAGSDSSGGAGIEADLKTFTAHKVYGLTCMTALTAQNTLGVNSIHPVPIGFLRDAMDSNLSDFLPHLKAVKTGMLTKDAVTVLAENISKFNDHKVKLVVDPVMISTSGSQLFDDEGMKLCVEAVLAQSYLVTPNYLEARSLADIVGLNTGVVGDLSSYVKFIEQLAKALGCANLLVKGGHIPWNSSTNAPFKEGDDPKDQIIIDVLYENETSQFTVFKSECIKSENTHGTGCSLASSIAANLAKGKTIQDAIALGIDYIHRGLVEMKHKMGKGDGPINHYVEPKKEAEEIIDSEDSDISAQLIKDHASVLDFFVNHPKIKDNWYTYTHHRFVELLAQNKLPFDRFLYFLKQDYYYLINYAQIHGIAAATAPTYHKTHSEALIIGKVVEEIEKHKQKLSKEYDIVYERDIDLDLDLQPRQACLDYCNYLLNKGKNEDYLGIKVALAPCLFGYHEAAKYGNDVRKKGYEKIDDSHSQTYKLWLDDYDSEWYSESYNLGKNELQDLVGSTPITKARLEVLVDMFNDVTKLEIGFWDEILRDLDI